MQANFTNSPVITLKGGVNQFMEPAFHFEETEASSLTSLRKGVKVIFVCIGAGDVIKAPTANSCQFIN